MNKNLHIGFITPEYSDPKVKHAAGIGTSIKNLAVALLKQNIKVTIFVYGQNTSEIYINEGVTIHLIEHKKYTLLGWYFYRKDIEKYVNKEVKKSNINILEAPDWTGITAFMRFKIPLIIRFHGTDTYFCYLEKRKQKRKNFFFEKKALKKATAYISPSKFTGELTQKLFDLDTHKIRTINHGIKLKSFNNDDPTNFKPKTLLYVGTLIRKKGVLELAKIFNKLVEEDESVILTLIGSDTSDVKTNSSSTFKLMKTLLTKKAISRVNYLGKLPYQQVKEHIKQAQVCVFPSFAETFGMVTVEAMAMQKPVINSNIGWSNELINNAIDGYLIHPTKTQEYVKQIKELFEDIDLCLLIGNAAQATVKKKFNIDKQVIENIDFYKATLNDTNFSS